MLEVVLPAIAVSIVGVILCADDPPRKGEERVVSWSDDTWEHCESFFFARMLAKAALLKGHTLTKDHEIKPVLVDVEESLKEQERDRKRRQKKEKLMSDVSARHSRVIFLFHVKICVIHLA